MSSNIPVLDAAAVARLMDRIDIAAALRSLFVALHAGRAVQAPQTVTLFPQDAGDVIAYPGVLAEAGVFGVKLSPYIVRQPAPLITAWTLLMSMADGAPLLLCDAKRLTTERTAATTALAVDLLAPAEAKTLAIVGTGEVALAHLRRVLPLRDWARVRVTSRRVASEPAVAFAAFTEIDPRVALAPSVAEAAADADVVMLCTSSGAPVLDPATLTRPALITSISTNVARAHEIPPEALGDLDVYCDYRATCPLSAGEMVLARERHSWSPDAILADLPELASGGDARRTPGRHAFFRSIGLGLEDIAVAAQLHRLLTDEGSRP